MAATVEGLSEVLNAFDNLAGIAKDPEMKNAFLREAEDFKDVIVQEAPRGPTGNLRGAIVAKKFRRKGESLSFVGINFRKAPHAHLVENGTVHSAPNPFFTRGFNRQKPNFGKHVDRVLEKKVKDV